MNWKFWKKKKKKINFSRSLNDIKNGCRVLFIDDQKFDIIDRLREKEGWKKTTWIKDLDSITQSELVDAHIVLVDIYGVGKKMKFPDEGLGVIVAIKNRYPQKKVIMYSGESGQKVDSFHQAGNLVDFRLRKTSTQYEFNNIIEKFANDAFCLKNCIQNIKVILSDDYHINMSEEEIEANIEKVLSKELSANRVSSIFNIENANKIIDVLQLFNSLGALLS